MNTFELEKVLNTFKPPEWDTGVFARNELRSPTEKCVFICNTDCSHNKGTHWVALSINDQGEGLYFDSYGLPPVFKEFSTFFEGHICTYNDVQLQRPFSLACGHYCALFALHTFAGCSMETTVNRMEKYSDDQIENFVEQILMK